MTAPAKPEYRFRMQIVDETNDEVIVADCCSLDPAFRVDEFGNCENVDIHVGSLLRHWQRTACDQYERENYATEMEGAE